MATAHTPLNNIQRERALALKRNGQSSGKFKWDVRSVKHTKAIFLPSIPTKYQRGGGGRVILAASICPTSNKESPTRVM